MKEVIVLTEVQKWSDRYNFIFQFWGEDNNNCYVEKDGVEMFYSRGYETPILAIITALNYIYKVNRTPHKDRIMNKCNYCGRNEICKGVYPEGCFLENYLNK